MLDGKADFDRALGRRIREAREGVGVQQDQLARAVGLSRTSITNIERGRQGVQAFLLARIAEVLGRPAAELLPGRDAQPQLPAKVKVLDPSKREWAERIMKPKKEGDEHAT
jgi:transcriptional regulator with XRE-family HTH domain